MREASGYEPASAGEILNRAAVCEKFDRFEM
jgi:hypothetical protein